MTDDIKRSRQRLNGAMPTSHEVGYAKPPLATRFQKGQSGNPRGRPKGAKSSQPRLNEERLKNVILTEAYRPIKVREGERNVTLSMAAAVVRSISVSAAKGQPRAQRLFTELLSNTEAANKRQADELLRTAIEYKVDWESEIERCKRLGLPAPEPLPHPKDIEINMSTGEVLIKGPITPEDKARQDQLRERKQECLIEIKQLSDELDETTDPSRRAFLEKEIEREQSIYDTISRSIND